MPVQLQIDVYTIVAGTTPEPFTWTIEDSNGIPLDLSVTGLFPVDTVTFEYRVSGGALVTRAGDQLSLAAGIIGWTPIAADFATPGFLEGSLYYYSGPDRRDGAQVQIKIVRAQGSVPGVGPPASFDGIIDGGSL